MKLRHILDKAIQTNMKRYGIGFAFHSEDSKNKGRSTCKERYGAEFPLQVKKIQEQIRKSCRNSLGVDYPLQSKEIQDKITSTFLEKYKMDRYEYLPKAIENSMMKKYGVKHPMHVEEIFNKMIKSCFKMKLYTFPSGRVEYCQGYEPQCLNHLITLYDEDDIVLGSSSIPPIWYDNPETERKSRYYPDAYIISENMVIEVKSWWTFKKDYDKNIAKFRRIVAMGFKMVLYM